MTGVTLARNALLVHVRGMDQLWVFKSRWEDSRSPVVGTAVEPDVAVGWKDLRVPGIHVPGVSTADSFYQESAHSGTRMTRRRPL